MHFKKKVLFGDCLDAAAWGRYIAACVHRNLGNGLQKIFAAWQWQLIIEDEDRPDFPLPRFAVWEGDTKTVRLFRAPLLRAFPHHPYVLALACAHEMFHGLAANSYQNVLPHDYTPLRLSHSDEENAANAFAHELITNFRLTLEA